jgi:hypothetical protein
MVATPQVMDRTALTFGEWKDTLRQDCERQDKLLEYSNLGEDCLKILWEAGTQPSVNGIIDGGSKAA